MWNANIVSWGCCNKIPQTGWLKQQTFISHSSGGWDVWEQGASMIGFWRRLSSWIAVGHFALCPHMLGIERQCLLVSLLLRVLTPSRRLHSHDLQFSSVAQSCLTLRPHESQHARPPCPSPTPGVHSDSRPLSQWCHPAISSSVVPFSSCPQSLPASKSFPMNPLFPWGGQSIGISALASFLPEKSQGWSPSEWTGWISLQSKLLSRVFSNTTLQKHQFFSALPSSQFNSHIHTWQLEKP